MLLWNMHGIFPLSAAEKTNLCDPAQWRQFRLSGNLHRGGPRAFLFFFFVLHPVRVASRELFSLACEGELEVNKGN